MRHMTINRSSLVLLLILFACKKQPQVYEYRETGPPVLKANPVAVNEVVAGYYSALPVHYDQTTILYPLLVCLHGAGQIGNGRSQLDKVLLEAVPQLLSEKLFPPSFKVNGQYYSFVVLIPQFKQQPSPAQVLSFITYAKSNYRIDTTRIYMTGLSEGSTVVCDAAAEMPRQFAAIVPIAGESRSGDLQAKCRSIAEGNLPVWLLHNGQDQLIPVQYAWNFITILNSFHPLIPPKYTELLPFGLGNHDAWTHATDPAFKEDGKNIYEWMLQYHR